MKLFKFALIPAFLLGISLSSPVSAIDLYVDTKTKQIFNEPGAGRVHLGTFRRDSGAASTSDAASTSEPTQASSDKVVKSNSASVTLDHRGLNFKSADGDFKFKVGGRLQADASFSGGDNFFDADGNEVEANDGTEIRRAYLVFKANFFKDWDYVTKIDFADNRVGIKDLYLKYKGLGFMDVIIGSQKQPFSKELQENSTDLIFMERSALSAITTPTLYRAIGINLFSYNKNTTAQLGVFGDTIIPNKRNKFADEGWGVVSRITHAPLFDPQQNRIINLGLSGNYREPNDAGDIHDKPLKMYTETTYMSNLKLVNASIKYVDRLMMVGGDVMAVMGPFSIGGEYAHIWIERKKGKPTLALNGWYGEAAWVLTGESRTYKKGKFFRVKPRNNFSLSKGTWGAWELAIRYGHVDLNHHSFKGGELDNISVALNWYLNENIRFMAGYDKVLDVKDSPYTTRSGKSPEGTDTFMFRSQLQF